MSRRRTRLHIGAMRVHKWLALFVGVQLLLWFTSGAVMSFLPIERVRGEHLVDRNMTPPIPADVTLEVPNIIARANAPVRSIRVATLLDHPIAEVETAKGKVLLDISTGAAMPTIDARTATAVALVAYRGIARTPPAAERVTKSSTEYRGSLPAWRIAFADADNTRVFVAIDTGRIAAVRTGTWRLYDFFWGLHIMDWQNHEDFNTPWLFAFAIGGLILALAGTILLVMRWPVRWR